MMKPLLNQMMMIPVILMGLIQGFDSIDGKTVLEELLKTVKNTQIKELEEMGIKTFEGFKNIKPKVRKSRWWYYSRC